MPGYYDSMFLSSYFNAPRGLWYHPVRDELYVADSGNSLIRRLVYSSGQVQTVVGSGNSYSGSDLDGDSGTSANLYFPMDVAGDTATDKLYLTDSSKDIIREYDISTNTVKKYAGGSSWVYDFWIGDGYAATSASLRIA